LVVAEETGWGRQRKKRGGDDSGRSSPSRDLVTVVWTSLGPLPRWVPGRTTR
jgi:hypothetical protein